MTASLKRTLLGCSLLLLIAAVAGTIGGYWWLHRGGPIVDRLQLVGPQSEAFVTFIAEAGDPAVTDLSASVLRRLQAAKKESQPEGMRFVAEFLSGAGISKDPERLFPFRATGTIENLPGGRDEPVVTLSLGRMANLARLLLGIVDSEREKETYRGQKIILAPGGRDFSLSLVGNNLVAARDAGAIRLAIDRLEAGEGGARNLPEDLVRCIQGLDPGREMPGFGAIVNDKKALATVWQIVTGAPEGAEVPLPHEFQGVGFRFKIASADSLHGEGTFYFQDEEVAAGAADALWSGLTRAFSHFGLKPDVDVRPEGSRLEVRVDARGVQAALDRVFARLQPAPKSK